MAEKKRLDVLLVECGMAPSIEKAQALIMAGKVLIGDTPVDKSGVRVPVDAPLRIRGTQSAYVSRGGEKLEGALKDMKLDPSGMDVLDVGASTGGFTDCLLKHGAATVCALDVGYGQIALSLRNNPGVTVLDRTNARNVTSADFDHLFDLITVDVSFISLLKVLPALAPLLREGGKVLALVKPQFEAGRESVSKGGVVRDSEVHEHVLREVIEGAAVIRLYAESLTYSILQGPKGNIEFFVLFGKNRAVNPPEELGEIVHCAHERFKN